MAHPLYKRLGFSQHAVGGESSTVKRSRNRAESLLVRRLRERAELLERNAESATSERAAKLMFAAKELREVAVSIRLDDWSGTPPC